MPGSWEIQSKLWLLIGTQWSCTLTALTFTGKSVSEAVILAPTNPQYDDRIDCSLNYDFSTRKLQVHYMLCTQIVLTFRTTYVSTQGVIPLFSPCSGVAIFIYWTCNSMNNLLSYCG